MTDSDRLAGFMSFATLGVWTTTQELAACVVESIEGADADLVAQEALALVATATARAARFSLRERPELAASAEQALLDLPLSWRDYVVGGMMLEDASASEERPDLEDAALDAAYRDLGRKLDFYGAHLPSGPMPGPSVLGEKMTLWMGRVSPPRLPEMPAARLERLGLVNVLSRHVRLVRAHGERPD